MRKIASILFLFLVLILYGCNKNVFATDITVTGISDSYNVGDVISLDDINIIINPINVTVKPNISVNDASKAEITDTEIIFKNSGECNIVFSVKSNNDSYVYYTKTVNIKNVTYANSLIFENNNVKVNFNDVATNRLIINPTNCSVTPKISYSNNNVVSYSYLTGEITPINVGSTTVTAKINVSKTETIQTSFVCTVTNNIYATSLTATVLNSNNVTLKTGYEGNVNCDVLPSNYNMGLSYSCSNNLITISNNGDFVVGNNAGIGKIFVKAKSQDGEIVKTIDFTIVETITELDVSLFYNNEPATKFYSGINYVACINTLNIDYNKVVFENCSYNYLEDNKFCIVFNNSGTTNFVAKYSYNLTSGVEDIKFKLNLMVYNSISDINFGLYNNETEILPVNSEYTLSLIDTNFITDALNSGVYYSATLLTSPKGINTCANDLSVEIVGDAVEYNNNIITANKVGCAIVKILSADPLGFNKTFKINVNEVTVSDIIIPNNEISLDLAENLSCNLTYSVMPTYAYDKVIAISKNNNVININNNVITALNYGECVVTLTKGLISKQVLVNVSPVPNRMEVKVENEIVSNNCCKTLNINSSVLISANLYYDDIKVNKNVDFYVNGESVNVTVDSVSKLFRATAVKLGESKVEFYYENLLFAINLNVEEENKIIQASFVEHSLNVNLFLTKQITPELELTYKFPDKELDNRNINLVSTDSGIAVVNGETINLIKIGNVTINLLLNETVVDTLKLNIYNEEIIEINSAENFNNLQNKHYLVTSTLDFTNFETINTFGGIIDFNNYSITGLSVPLFKTLESTSVIKNLKFVNNITLNGNQTSSYSIIAENNNGKIDNISFENLSVSVNNASSVVFLSLICINNNGEIKNINFNNVTVSELRDNVTSSASRFNGVTTNNNGVISGVTGILNISNYVKTCGVCDTTSGNIENIVLELNIITNNKFIGAGLVYTISSENLVNISNVNLKVNMSGDTIINAFGGVIRSINSSCDLQNLEVNLNLNSNYSSDKLAIFCNNVNSSVDVILNNCKYNSIDGFNAVISGELTF